MTPTLLIAIGLLLLFCGWQQYRHEAWIERHLTPAPEPPPLRYSDLLPEEPFPLVVRADMGWGTLLDIAPTKIFRASPVRYPSCGVALSPDLCVRLS